MKLIIALGNPGKEYEKTRHNAGWLAIDEYLKGKEGITCTSKFQASICEMHFGSTKVFFAKPQTYMNNSGHAVREILSFYKLNPETDILVLHDEVDLPLGELRLSKDSRAGGHNGVRSIIEHIGTKNFSRLRIGVESREDKKIPNTSDFVLQPFTTNQLKELGEKIFPEVNKEIEKFI